MVEREKDALEGDESEHKRVAGYSIGRSRRTGMQQKEVSRLTTETTSGRNILRYPILSQPCLHLKVKMSKCR